MTMKFRQVKDALVETLGSKADGRYKVIGYEEMSQPASDYAGNNRTVRVMYTKGKFPMQSGSLRTPCDHDIEYDLEIISTADSTGVDLGIIEDPNSTDSQRAAALAGSSPAAKNADDNFDDLVDILWNILMAHDTLDLGLDEYTIRSRWVTEVVKDRLVPNGEYAILTGYIRLSLTVEEKAEYWVQPVEFEKNRTEFSPIDGDDFQATVAEHDATTEE